MTDFGDRIEALAKSLTKSASTPDVGEVKVLGARASRRRGFRVALTASAAVLTVTGLVWGSFGIASARDDSPLAVAATTSGEATVATDGGVIVLSESSDDAVPSVASATASAAAMPDEPSASLPAGGDVVDEPASGLPFWTTPNDATRTGQLACSPARNVSVWSAFNLLVDPVGGIGYVQGARDPGAQGLDLVDVPGSTSPMQEISWSPTGDYAALLADGVWIFDASRGIATKVSYGSNPEPQSDYPISWAADGSRFAFAVGTMANSRSVVVVDVPSGNTHWLREPAGVLGFDLSPDGKELAYGTNPAGHVLPGAQVIRIDVVTGSVRGHIDGATSPTYSPDGTSLAVFGDLDLDGDMASYVVNLSTGVSTALSDGGSVYKYWNDYLTPVWSPDGSSVAGVTGTSSGIRLAVANSSGSNVKVFTEQPTPSARPVWSLNSKTVVAAGPGGYVSVTGTAAVVRDVRGEPDSLRASGSGFVLTAWPCAQWPPTQNSELSNPIATFQSVATDSSLADADLLLPPAGWLDLGVPVESPDGDYTLRVLAGPYSTAGLYLSQN